MIRPNLDIVRTSINEEDEQIRVELEVLGYIKSQNQSYYHVHYIICLENEEGEHYCIIYDFGDFYMSWEESKHNITEYSGFGANTLKFSFSLYDIGNPDSLSIKYLETYEYTHHRGSGEYYKDSAEPEGEPTIEPSNEKDEIPGFHILLLAVSVILPEMMYHKRR